MLMIVLLKYTHTFKIKLFLFNITFLHTILYRSITIFMIHDFYYLQVQFAKNLLYNYYHSKNIRKNMHQIENSKN